MSLSETHRVIDAVWRSESAKVIAGLMRMVRDIGLAEELAQDALVIALEKWPRTGVPDNPGAWLMATSKHRAIDRLRRSKLAQRKHEELGRELESAQDDAAAGFEELLDDDIGDNVLRLVFTACHPMLSADAQVALTLRLLGGLTTDEIARAFLVPEPTIAQRIVRAKRTLAKANVPFEVPRADAREERLATVLGVLYLIFNEGYSATAGEDWMRPALCAEALRLTRLVAELAPQEPEVHGLLALMELQASRTNARTGANGEPVLLLDQDRSRWDASMIRRGLDALQRAQSPSVVPGPYVLQAAIAACHARASVPVDTDWPQIASLYALLVKLAPSPVVELNRAVAVSMVEGPAAGLRLVDMLASEPALRQYHLLPTVRADLLVKLGRHAEAEAQFKRAADLTRNDRERDLLMARARVAADAANS